MLYLEKRFAWSSSLVATFKVTTFVSSSHHLEEFLHSTFDLQATYLDGATGRWKRDLVMPLENTRSRCWWSGRSQKQIYCRTIPFCMIRKGAEIQTICFLAWCFLLMTFVMFTQILSKMIQVGYFSQLGLEANTQSTAQLLLNPKWHMLMAIWAVREQRVYFEGSKYAFGMSTVSKMILDKESLRSNQCNQIPIHVPSHSFKISPSTTQRKSHIFALQEGAQVVKWRQGESSKGWKVGCFRLGSP